MKTAFTILLIVIAVIACGCTAAAPATAPATAPAAATVPASEPVIPDLVGSWTGPMQGYDAGTGFSTYPGIAVTINVTEQQGRIFAGSIIVERNGTSTSYGFAGAVGRDNRTLTIAENDGTYTGTVVGGDAIELMYVQPGPAYSIAIDSFTRV